MRSAGLILAIAVACMMTQAIGCPKDPYRAALQGSDGVSNGVHEAIVTIGNLYSQGVASDSYKVAAARYLDGITDCNMIFRKTVVQTHNAGQTGAAAFLPIANAFVTCTEKQVPPSGPADNVLKVVETAINGISLAIQNAKGGTPQP